MNLLGYVVKHSAYKNRKPRKCVDKMSCVLLGFTKQVSILF
jgi:hypothetical protein